jgi:hypothetical protein
VRKSLVAQLAQEAAEPENLSPFERFSDLTKRLVAVPKVEVDKLQATERRAKVKKRADAGP